MSFEKRSLLITVDHFYFKVVILPKNKHTWFSAPIEEYAKNTAQQLKQLTASSKR